MISTDLKCSISNRIFYLWLQKHVLLKNAMFWLNSVFPRSSYFCDETRNFCQEQAGRLKIDRPSSRNLSE